MTGGPSFRINVSGAGRGRYRLQGRRKQALEIGRTRLLVTGVLFVVAFALIAGRLVELSLLDRGHEPRLASPAAGPETPVARANIVDRNGVILATSLPTASLFVDPQEFKLSQEDPAAAAAKLRRVLPELDRDTVIDRLTGPGRFVWLKRNLTPNEQWRVIRLGIPGLDFQSSERRTYPHGRTAAHVLGLTDIDGRGIAGIEKAFDGRLAAGETLRLSLDVRLQAMLHDELAAAMAEFQAMGAAGLVLDATSGELLALVSLPDFDPNDPGSLIGDAGFNRVTKGVYELGSTFKVFNTAIGLDTGTVGLEDGYDASQPLRLAGYMIRDFHPENRWLSVPEILVHSSNIGAAKMALVIGTETQRRYMRELGLLRPARVELPEVGRPLAPSPWREINTATISYGHGIAVSPLQLASGIAAVVNDGLLHEPTVLAGGGEAPRRVFSPRTSARMRAMLRMVVSDGTGKRAAARGYRVGGKTGTAEKMIGGQYRHDRLISSFVGAFPMDDPRYVVLALVDEPQGNENTYYYATAGWTAAPVVGRVIDRMAPLLGIAPRRPAAPETPEKDGEHPGVRAVMATLAGNGPLAGGERRLATN